MRYGRRLPRRETKFSVCLSRAGRRRSKKKDKNMRKMIMRIRSKMKEKRYK